jgi:DtxR family Mn-dependent transcriptional regulator
MSQADVSPTIEDYLGIIYILERDGEDIAGVRLATIRGVTPPTVTNTLKRMVRDGLLQLDDDHDLHLTSEGMQNAR